MSRTGGRRIRGEHGIEKVAKVECVAGMGPKGDLLSGFKPDFKGKVTFFDVRAFDAVREHFNPAWRHP